MQTMNALVNLGRLDEIPDGEARGYDPAGNGRDTLFVVRLGSVLHGWRDGCPHEVVTPLPYRRHKYLNAARTRIVCHAHGAQFDIATGECLRGPCLGQALTRVPLNVDGNGEILADVTCTGMDEMDRGDTKPC